MKSKNYNMIKSYYELSLWGVERVWNLVNKSLGITEEEYTEITNFVYSNKQNNAIK